MIDFWRQKPAIAGLLAVATFITAAIVMDRYEAAESRTRLQANAEIAAGQISSRLDFVTTALERMANRWTSQGGLSEAAWRADASAYHQDFPEIIANEWADTAYRVRWIEPMEGNEAAMGLDLTFEPNRARALRAAVRDNQSYITPLVELVQGGSGFLAFFPVQDSAGEPAGLLLNVINLEVLARASLEERDLNALALELLQEGETVFSLGEAQSQGFHASRQIEFAGHSWELRAYEPVSAMAGARLISPVLICLVGLLVGAAIYLLLADARSQARRREEIARDIEAERNRIAAANAFRNLIVSNVPDYVFVKDENFVIVDANEKFLSLYPEAVRDSVIGTTTLEQYEAGEREEFLREDRIAFAEGRSETEERINFPDGAVRTLFTQKIRFEDEAGRPFILGLARDITEQKESARLERRAREHAERSDQVKSEFLANMSHEIRTPMNAILGLARILERDDLPEAAAGHAHLITESAESLLAILNDILDLSKVQSDEVELEVRPFRLSDLVRSVERLNAPGAIEKGLTFEVSNELSGRDGLRLGDTVRLGQVLNNFLSNAIKFTETGSVELRVSACPGEAAGPDGVRLSIRDTGIGMDEEQCSRVFEKFVQGDASTTRLYGGTGLGLAIAKRLIDCMGGDMRVESAPGSGTCFEIDLPLESAGVDAIGAHNHDDDIVSLGPLRILAVEDNKTNRIVLDAHLRSLDAEIVMAENGAEAVDLFMASRFDLVLMDIHMPVMNGEEALARIRALEAEEGRMPTPVIALTADAMKHQVQARLARGFDGHLAKPIEPDRMFALIASLCSESIGIASAGSGQRRVSA